MSRDMRIRAAKLLLKEAQQEVRLRAGSLVTSENDYQFNKDLRELVAAIAAHTEAQTFLTEQSK